MRTRASLRVKLYRKRIVLWIIHTLTGIVICVYKAQDTLTVFRNAVGDNGITVVLTRYVCSRSVYLFYGLINSAVSVFELFGFSSDCKSRELMAEAYSEHGHLSEKLAYLRNLELVIGRVTGSV